ncbi:MAG: hypothetical protein II807_07435 [Thermoguttaceae bacterium]|nr:hypothetical protein [Thermoguttaceae bacterium]
MKALSKKNARVAEVAQELLANELPVVARYEVFKKFQDVDVLALQKSCLKELFKGNKEFVPLFIEFQEMKGKFEDEFNEQFERANSVLQKAMAEEGENGGEAEETDEAETDANEEAKTSNDAEKAEDEDADCEDEDEDEDEEDKAAERRITVMMEAAKLNAIAVDYLKKVLEFTKRIQVLCEK